MSKFKPSKHQQAIFDFIQNGTQNAIISAVAGSGKTTTLVQALELIPTDKTVLFMAFNKSIAAELKKRVPKTANIEVKTVHGFGYSLLRKLYEPPIDNRKYSKMLKDIIEYHTKKTKSSIEKYGFNIDASAIVGRMAPCGKIDTTVNKDYFQDIIALCNLGRLNLIDIENKTNGINELNEISKIHSIGTVNGEVYIAWYLIKLGMYYINEVDYSDMIFLASTLPGIEFDLYDFVFIDECQDLNTGQRVLMERAIKPETGRFVAVGDPKQAIYGFAGADFSSFTKLTKIPNTVELPLSVTYRCASSIVDKVKHINEAIMPVENAKVGEVLQRVSYKEIKDGDMVLCRNTLPIVSLCIKFLIEGKRAHIIGSDIGMSLCKMISDCQRVSEEFTMANVFSRLYAEKQKIIDKLIKNQHMTPEEARDDEFVNIYNEKIQVIEALSDKITDPNETIRKIHSIFSDTNTVGITLSTIHKSKGLEADRVFILQRELMPSRYAVTDQQLEQEQNLRYVAYTRAKTTLGFIHDFEAYGSHKSQKDNVNAVVESKHIGTINSKIDLDLTILNVKSVKTAYGDCLLIDMKDKHGNLFNKFGDINAKFIVGPKKELKPGTEVSFTAVVSDHTEFRGIKTTKLGRLS